LIDPLAIDTLCIVVAKASALGEFAECVTGSGLIHKRFDVASVE
jgi:hypothetical protein